MKKLILKKNDISFIFSDFLLFTYLRSDIVAKHSECNPFFYLFHLHDHALMGPKRIHQNFQL